MAQLTIPADFERQHTLLQNIIAEDETLAADSPIRAFLQQQKIVLADDAAAGETARTHEAARSLLKKQSENYRQLRDNFFAKPWQNLTGSVQFLKKFYTGNTKELGNWGVTITEGGKVIYPAAFDDRIAVSGDFVQKHQSFEAGASPLQPYL